ncbi:MAG: cupin-like domain-containing protein [Bacteroidota bacterium]
MLEKQMIHNHPFTVKAIPRIGRERWNEVAEEARSERCPLVITKLFSQASQDWSPEKLAAQWGDREVNVVVDLPAHGTPYKERSNKYVQQITLGEFIELLRAGKSCYLNQAPLHQYPYLLENLAIKKLKLSRIFALNLWVGNKTRSGLHFDNADNLFGQIYGTKRVYLVSPAYSKYLYPFLDNPSKSQVDLEAPDMKKYPKSRQIEVWTYTLHPGDGLFMPRGWWHHICSNDISISVNCWHGESLTELEYLKMIFASGLPVLGRAVYDFVWHGLFKRPYEHRLFSPPSPGLTAYHKLILKR